MENSKSKVMLQSPTFQRLIPVIRRIGRIYLLLAIIFSFAIFAPFFETSGYIVRNGTLRLFLCVVLVGLFLLLHFRSSTGSRQPVHQAAQSTSHRVRIDLFGFALLCLTLCFSPFYLQSYRSHVIPMISGTQFDHRKPIKSPAYYTSSDGFFSGARSVVWRFYAPGYLLDRVVRSELWNEWGCRLE